MLRRALEAACDETRRKPAAEGDGATAGDGDAAASAAAVEEQPTPAQRQADAIGMVAEAALAVGLDRGTAGDRYQVVLHVDAEALTEPRGVPAGTSAGAAAGPGQRNPGRCAAAERSAGVVGSGRERPGGYVPAGTPDGDAGLSSVAPRREGRRWRRTSGPCPGARPAPSAAVAPGPPAAPPAGSQTVLDEAGGIHVPAETARRVACDAAAVTMRHGPGGEILDVGRRTRTVSPALRRALAARDRQCRFPGCGNRRCDAHHVEHWADGGPTALDNLVLLCRRHHRALHEEGFRITRNDVGSGQPISSAPAHSGGARLLSGIRLDAGRRRCRVPLLSGGHRIRAISRRILCAGGATTS